MPAGRAKLEYSKDAKKKAAVVVKNLEKAEAAIDAVIASLEDPETGIVFETKHFAYFEAKAKTIKTRTAKLVQEINAKL